MSKKYDDFDDADQGGMFDQIFGIISNKRREFAIVSVVAAVLVLGLIVWDSASGNRQQANESVPIVRADAGDYKTTPVDAGGMEIPYRDSTVFSSVDGDDGQTENLLADESSNEEPMAKEELFAGLNTQTEQVVETAAEGAEVKDTLIAMQKVEPVLAPTDKDLVQEAIGTADTAAVAKAPEKVEPVVAKVAKEEAKVVAKTETAAGSTAAKAVTPGGYFVQLASVKDNSGAASEYKKMQVKYNALNGVDFRTQKAELGSKGTFYRIQAGPMSKDSAASICSSIKSSGGSCLVVAK